MMFNFQNIRIFAANIAKIFDMAKFMKSEIPKPGTRILHDPETAGTLKKLQKSKLWDGIKKAFTSRYQGVTPINFSSRLINNWTNEGVLEETRKGGRGWRKYSLVDLVWLQVVSDLREFGFPVERLSKIRNRIYSTMLDELIFFIFKTFECRKPVSIVVFTQGEISISYLREYISTCQKKDLSSHIHIRLDHVLQKLHPKINLSAIDENSGSITSILKLLMLLRSGQYNEILINSKDGKIHRIRSWAELEKIEILNAILSGNYDDYAVIDRRGTVKVVEVQTNE